MLIELVLVVLGVFLGFQVTAWNDARHDNQRRIETIALLQDEATGNIRALEARVAMDRQDIADNNVLARAVSTGTLDASDRPAFERALARYEYSPTLPIRDSAYSALEQSGDLALIRDRALLVKLSSFQSQVRWVDGQNRYFRLGYNTFAGYWRPHVWHHLDPATGKRYITYDLAALAADKQAASAVIEVDRMHAIFATYVRQTLDQAIVLCRALAAHSGKPCRPGDAAGT